VSQQLQIRLMCHNSSRSFMCCCHGITGCTAGGGLFGGLFGGGKQAQQQEKQQQQQPQQQQQQQPAPAAAPVGTPSDPEFPPYRLLQKGSTYDLRFYEVYPVVEIDYHRREEGYLALGSYQGGANSSSSRFGHTQPVVMSYHNDVSTYISSTGSSTHLVRN